MGADLCSEINASLVTWYDEEDVNFTRGFISTTWLGLNRARVGVSSWSDGSDLTFRGSNVTITEGEQICEAVEQNQWRGFNCSDRKPFMCYRGSFQQKLHLKALTRQCAVALLMLKRKN